MELDLPQIPRTKARWKNTSAGLDYLFTRIRRELEERWVLAQHAAQHNTTQNTPHVEQPKQPNILLLDGNDSDFRVANASIQLVSIFDSLTTPAPFNFHQFADCACDGIVLCLQPAWLTLDTMLTGILRKLRPGGKLLFCTFGPDTLVQLRWAWQQVDQFPHVHPFVDMHIIGDQLLQCGFRNPILDVDRVTVEYAQISMLVADLRAEGFINILSQRRKTCTGKSRTSKFHKALDSLRSPDQPLAITYELIYGVATAPSSTPLPPAPIRVAPPKIGS